MKYDEVIKRIAIIIFFVAVFHSCNVQKYVPEGKYLVTKNSIDIVYPDSIQKKHKVSKSTALNYIPLSQTPATRVLGIDIRTWLYMKSKPNKQNWGNKTLRKMGKEPVYYDTTETQRSIQNMSLYMTSMGYLDNTITSDVKFKGKRAYINYHIISNQPYFIDTLTYNIKDINVETDVRINKRYTKIKEGDILSRYTLDAERKRITDILHEKGFYTFGIDDIDYLVDTLHNSHLAKVQINVNQNKIDNKNVNHKVHKIRNVYVFPNNNGKLTSKTVFDTIKVNNINYLYQNKKENVKAKFINRQILFSTDSVWSPSIQELTTRNFMNLKYYKNSSIEFSRVNMHDSLSSYGFLDTYISLMPGKLHGIKAEAEISSNSNYTSLIARVGYSNSNLFRHSEKFNITLNTGYDFFYEKGRKDAYQFGISTSLSFPKLIVPFRVKPSKFIYDIESVVSINYNMQNRPYYRRHILNSTFGYKWSNGNNLRFYYNPATLTYINLPWIDEGYLNTLTNPYLKNTYTNHLIAGTNFGLKYSVERKIGSSWNLKVNTETAGNTLYLGNKVFKGTVKTNELNEKYYEILNMRFSQYARIDMDFGYKFNFNPKSAIVTRFYLGMGSGYGNSTSMPFERLFFSGGNSSMRGWQIRALGPGTKPIPKEQIDYPNSVGDIRLELNLEGRFPIWGIFRGAIFVDTGNTWSNGRGETDDRAIFHINSFYKQLGLNTGIGLRLDLDFFVLRLDWGIILHNPNNPEGQRWINNFALKNTALHFAIGYPF